MPVTNCCGVLNLNKPTGITSRGVVDQISRLVRPAKVGHAGTLDPLATGVLVVCLGAATRLIEYVQRMPKRYRTVIRLGVRSESHDSDSHVIEMYVSSIPAESSVRAALDSQVGTILQTPPQYSAVKVAGRRAYRLAREGQQVYLPPRDVYIERIEILAYQWPLLELEITCGSGTYIRSIARDLGEALECGGIVEVLTRTCIGNFRLEDSYDPRRIDTQSLRASLLPAADALGDMPRVVLDPQQVRIVARGKALDPLRLLGFRSIGSEFALMSQDGELVAIAEASHDGRSIHPRRVIIMNR